MENIKFTPKQWVLVRDYYDEDWSLAQFSHKIGDSYVAVGGIRWKQCIPYEGNEQLLGQIDDPYELLDGENAMN